MPSELETKQNNVRIERGLLKQRLSQYNISFNVDEITNSMMSTMPTEQMCDILLSQFKALNDCLDEIWSKASKNT